LEHRRHSDTRRRTRRLDVKTKARTSADITVSLPNIENLITYGDILSECFVRWLYRYRCRRR
jgi:hypothetical protein